MANTANIKSKPIYFPGLNGLRAIAAIAVVISHTTLALKEFGLNPFIFGAYEDGSPKGVSLSGFGVSIFFVLSGFLITYLLLAEKTIQPIDIKKFYFRRMLRIWPLYYLYLVIAVAVLCITATKVQPNLLMLYIFYSPNVPLILGIGLPLLSHYWSLGVEEQFYLFWPWVIKKINRFIVPAIAAVIVLLVGIKLWFHVFHPNSIIEAAIHVTRFHCMMLGALGAIWYRQQNELFLLVAGNKVTQAVCWLIILLLAINQFHFASVIDNEIVACAGLCLIIGQINVQNRLINLEINLFDYLGKISYGIYVVHPLIIFIFSKLIGAVSIGDPYKYVVVYASVLASTIFVAHLSYTYFEKYFMNLKKKFVVVPSLATKKHGLRVVRA